MSKVVSNKIGKVSINKKMYKATIIDYISSLNVKVQFDDGSISNMQYAQFKNGAFEHPSNKRIIKCNKSILGKTKIGSNGVIATIIDYKNCRDITLRLSDGSIIEHTSFKVFEKGCFSPKCGVKGSTKHKNEKELTLKYCKMTCGLIAHIIKYKNAVNMDIEFEDGTVINDTYYVSFLKGCIRHPKYSNCVHAATFNNKKYFLCTCKKCKGKHMLCIDEMKDFECTIRG